MQAQRFSGEAGNAMLSLLVIACASFLTAAEIGGQSAEVAADAPIVIAQHMPCVPPDGFAVVPVGDENLIVAKGSEYGISVYAYDPEGHPAPVHDGYRVPYLVMVGGFFLGGDIQVFWIHVRDGYTLSFNPALSEAYTNSTGASVIYFDSFEEDCYPHCIKRQYLLEIGNDRRVKLNGVEIYRIKEWAG